MNNFHTPCAGYILRLFEIGAQDVTIMDSLWILLMSVSTVGYGDVYPITDGGRCVLIAFQIFGVVLFSTLVAVVQSKLSLSNRYIRVFSPKRIRSLAS
jgi:hypothetical protein